MNSSDNRHEPRRARFTRALIPICLLLVIAATVSLVFLRHTGAQNLRADAVATPVAQADGARVRVSESYGKMPLAFEANVGQAKPETQFLSRGSGYTLALMQTGAELTLRRNNAPARRDNVSDESEAFKPAKRSRRERITSSTLSMKLVGANVSAVAEPLGELETKSNYLVGRDSSKWRTNISNYAQVRYSEVYQGIAVVYYGNQQHLEYDFLIAPGADPQAIRLAFDGIKSLTIAEGGDLVLRLSDGEVRQSKPLVYQETETGRREVKANYVLTGEREIGFELGEYDRSKPLVIDPILAYSTYLNFYPTQTGGIALDAGGNMYVTGSDGDNVYVAKINPQGSAFVYTALIGGGDGDSGSSIAVDASGNAYVGGDAYSDNFPVVNAFQPTRASDAINIADSFLFKLNPAGTSLLFSTFLGGGEDDLNYGLALDAAGNAYITGLTESPYPADPMSLPFPTVNAYQSTLRGGVDGYLTKFNSSGGVVYSTYLGGDNYDYALDVAVDADGAVYLTGQTYSTNFPTVNPLQGALAGSGADAFITKFNPDGASLAYSTYFGGTLEDLAWGIALDSSKNIYLTGYTRSANFPTMNPVQAANGGTGRDAFITKLNAAGTALVYSTYLGGTNAEEAADIYVSQTGAAYVCGFTGSSNFPLVNPIQTSNNNSVDAFITKLNAAGTAFDYSTYLGGSTGFSGPGSGSSDYGSGIVVDAGGTAYIFGETYSNNFPLVNPLQATLSTISGAFLSKINESGNQTFYTINGIIENNNGNRLAGVTVTLSGTQSAQVVTSAIGTYSFNNLAAGGTYTVTPSHPTLTFDPPSQTFENLSTNQTADFMRAPRTYHISGRITDGNGNGIPNVTVDISGYIYPITRSTDAQGNFVLMYLEGNRQYTVTPRHPNYSFTPLSRSFLLTSNQLATNFTGINNQGLAVSMTGPAAGTLYQAPAIINVSADATSANSTVTKVDFFANGTLIGTDTTAPYSIVWTNLTGGVYSLSALATDALGATKASGTVPIIVNSVGGPSVAITNPAEGSTLFSGGYIYLSANASSLNGDITKVDFYEGTRLLGTDTTGSPYTLIYFLYAGTYTLTAVATDSTGAVTQSSPVHLTVVDNQSPRATLTSPPNYSTYPAGANVTMTADASDADGTVASVKFFAGGTLIGTDTTAPYTATWNNAQTGVWALVAMATDDRGQVGYSNPVDIQVGNRPPTVTITSPASQAQYTAPANIHITAQAFDQDGTVAQVEFFGGGTLIGTDTTAPYSADWTNVPAGDYDLVCKVTDNEGATAYSSFRFIRVFANVPMVSITQPTAGATFTAPATINISADASIPGGTINSVGFYAGTQNLGFDSTPPYNITWSNVPAGTYSITAVASDSRGAETTSAPVTVNVTGNIGNWSLQLPLPTSTATGALEEVDMISAMEGWAVSGGGEIYHTTNGGASWETQDNDSDEPLNAVSFFDAQHGIVIGNAAFYTTDGGQTWQQANGVLGSYYGLDFVDANTAYACGGGGIVLKSTDGGRNWTVIPTPIFTNPNLIAIDFVDANTGWAVGANGAIIRTINGGLNWTIQNGNTTGFFGGVSFVNANEGWAVAGNVLIHTTNGGASWTRQTVPSNTWVYDLFFLDAQNGWGVGSEQNVIHTTDGGQTWTTQRGGIGSGFSQPLWGVSFGDAQHGIAVGNGVLLYTTDGGQTWNEPGNNFNSVPNRIFATDAAHAWSANSKAEILYTTNGGLRWNQATLFTPTATSRVTDVIFRDNQNGWATVNEGPPGFIYKTTDGGQTWQNAGAPASASLYGIAVVDAQTLVAIGKSGLILRSTNNGATWASVASTTTADLNDVQFVNATTGWIVGNQGKILRSTDGGATWTAQSSGLGSSAFLLSVSFIDAQNGWAVGGSNLLHTTDGGASWTTQNADQGLTLKSVQALTPTSAWVAGYYSLSDSYVAQTTDGGQSWNRDNLYESVAPNTCFFVDENNGWVGGSTFASNTEGRLYHRAGNPPAPAPLVIALTSPADGDIFDGTPITIAAQALNSDVLISQVDFFDGATLIGTDTTAPYSIVWSSAPTGRHTLTARATASARGENTTSFAQPVTINVTSAINAPPAISLTSPTANSVYGVGAGIPLAANATDSDGSISRVEFYAGTSLIATDTASPYQTVWPVAAAGTYQLTAVAFDNNGASTTSSAISVSIIRRTAAIGTFADFDGDGRTDVSVFRPDGGNWYITNSSDAALRAVQFGTGGDRPAPGDYDGDGKSDICVWRPSDGYWYFINSSDGALRAVQFGLNGDIPATGDYDGDGKSDVAVYRPSAGTFYLLQSSDGAFHYRQWGTSGDVPLMGDYDGDGKTDFTVFRANAGAFYVLFSSDGQYRAEQFGLNGDKPIAADFDGDGRTDISVYRPSSGAWYYLQSSDNGFRGVAWGTSEDLPATGDYDGDGKWDVAVFRPSSGSFYILQSATNALRGEQFGISGDVPVTSAYVR